MKKVVLFVAVLLLFAVPYALVIFSTGAIDESSANAQSQVTITSTPSPIPTHFPYINVTRKQYEAALATWRAQGVTEYEIAVDHSLNSDVCILHVQTDGTTAHVISVSRGQETDSEVENVSLTVEDMFKEVKHRLDYASDPNLYWPISRDSLYWTVSFDPMLGYPSLVAWKLQPDADIVYIEGSKHVKSFRIIKQRLPNVSQSTPSPVP